jgi:hypothetical protein
MTAKKSQSIKELAAKININAIGGGNVNDPNNPLNQMREARQSQSNQSRPSAGGPPSSAPQNSDPDFDPFKAGAAKSEQDKKALE